jgi:hypothetical protein
VKGVSFEKSASATSCSALAHRRSTKSPGGAQTTDAASAQAVGKWAGVEDVASVEGDAAEFAAAATVAAGAGDEGDADSGGLAAAPPHAKAPKTRSDRSRGGRHDDAERKMRM